LKVSPYAFRSDRIVEENWWKLAEKPTPWLAKLRHSLQSLSDLISWTSSIFSLAYPVFQVMIFGQTHKPPSFYHCVMKDLFDSFIRSFWFRKLEDMHEFFPSLFRVFHWHDFNLFILSFIEDTEAHMSILHLPKFYVIAIFWFGLPILSTSVIEIHIWIRSHLPSLFGSYFPILDQFHPLLIKNIRKGQSLPSLSNFFASYPCFSWVHSVLLANAIEIGRPRHKLFPFLNFIIVDPFDCALHLSDLEKWNSWSTPSVFKFFR
jgi:hypothetical protein